MNAQTHRSIRSHNTILYRTNSHFPCTATIQSNKATTKSSFSGRLPVNIQTRNDQECTICRDIYNAHPYRQLDGFGQSRVLASFPWFLFWSFGLVCFSFHPHTSTCIYRIWILQEEERWKITWKERIERNNSVLFQVWPSFLFTFLNVKHVFSSPFGFWWAPLSLFFTAMLCLWFILDASYVQNQYQRCSNG